MTQALEYLERLLSGAESKICNILERADFANVYLCIITVWFRQECKVGILFLNQIFV